MAYSESYDDAPVATAPERAGASAIVGWLGAATSVALLAGLGYWVYDLATRDSREIPVVKAMVGPSRSAPENPGGFEAAHQGYSVNSLATEADEAPLSERVVLAPEDVLPAPEDIAPAQSDDPLNSIRDAVQGALSEVLGEEADLPQAAPDDLGEPHSSGIPAAPRPTQRPKKDVVTRSATASSGFISPLLGQTSLAPKDIAAGTPMVQLGDFASTNEAELAWADLSSEFFDFLSQKSRVIQPVLIAGQERYRLRAVGFDDQIETRNLCAALIAEQADCIPVQMR